jgi:hypothetical protein
MLNYGLALAMNSAGLGWDICSFTSTSLEVSFCV